MTIDYFDTHLPKSIDFSILHFQFLFVLVVVMMDGHDG